MAGHQVSCVSVLPFWIRTIALGESIAHPAVALIIHPLDHQAIPLKVVTHVVATASISQPINLLLSPLGSLLRLFELLLQLFDFAVLLCIPCLLSMLLPLIRDTLPQSH